MTRERHSFLGEKMKREGEALHFFKIIFEKTLQERKLRIPPKFVRKYGKDIPSKIVVKDSTGASWGMGVSRCANGEVWMQNGWDKFAEHYSLRYGHFLMFRYEGKGHFYITIFDRTGSEINYPCVPKASSGASGSKCACQKNDVKDVEFMGSRSGRRKTEGNFHFSSSLPKRRSLRIMYKDTRQSTSAEINRNLHPCRTSARETRDVAVPRAATRWETENVMGMNQCASYAQRKDKALKRALAFVSDNPFFRIVMHPSYIYPARAVAIPATFAKQYLGLDVKELVLQVSDRSWTVKYRLRTCNERILCSIYSNWKSFVQDNDLNVGDVCVFELLKGRKKILKVTVFHVMENEDVGLSVGLGSAIIETNLKTQSECKTGFDAEGSSDKGCEAPERQFLCGRKTEEADDDVSIGILNDTSHCEKEKGKLPFSPSQSLETMRIETNNKIKRKSVFPLEDCEAEGTYPYSTYTGVDQIKRQRNTITVDLKNVGTSSDQDGTRGAYGSEKHWQSASVEYPTSTMLLAYVDPGHSVIKEQTLKNVGTDYLKNQNSCSDEGDAGGDIDFVSKYPFFKVVLSRSSFRGHYLQIPVWFRRNFNKTEEHVTLRFKGESWPVKLLRSSGRLSAGWAAFCRANSLRAGDVCVFEVVSTHEIVLNVTIFQRCD